jgi:hypothetical protein
MYTKIWVWVGMLVVGGSGGGGVGWGG